MENPCTHTLNVANKKRCLLFLITLTLMSTAGLVGSDVYLPTLPEIGQLLMKDSHAMQFTLSIYLFGLSFGQLIFGPLTDRYGRKKLLMGGMFLYLLASLACAFSTTYSQLLAARLAQALGACTGLVIGRAIVGDLYDARDAGKIFSTIFPFVGMSPAISPVIGGLIGYHFGWPATFFFVGLFALSVIILSFYHIHETLSIEKRKPLHLLNILRTYPAVLKNKRFLFYVSAPCIAYIAYFAYIAQSPFILHSLGYGERAIGFFYITLSITYVAGNLLGKKLLHSFTLDKTLRIGYCFFVAGGFFLALAGIFSWPLSMMVISISLLTLGNGFLIPLGAAGAVSSCSGSVGYASGLLGFLQLGAAAITTAYIAALSNNQIVRLGLFIFLATLVGLFLHLMLRKSSIDYEKRK